MFFNNIPINLIFSRKKKCVVSSTWLSRASLKKLKPSATIRSHSRSPSETSASMVHLSAAWFSSSQPAPVSSMSPKCPRSCSPLKQLNLFILNVSASTWKISTWYSFSRTTLANQSWSLRYQWINSTR